MFSYLLEDIEQCITVIFTIMNKNMYCKLLGLMFYHSLLYRYVFTQHSFLLDVSTAVEVMCGGVIFREGHPQDHV